MPDFSKLVAVLEEILNTSNQTRDIIQIQCDEIRHLLMDWSVPDCGESVELPDCTCHNTAIVNEPEEIAKDIDKALDHAKKLRIEKTISTQKRSVSNSNSSTNLCNVKPVNQTTQSNYFNPIPTSKSSSRMVTCNSETVGIKKVATRKNNAPIPKKKSLGDSCSKPVNNSQNKDRNIYLPSSSRSKKSSGERAAIRTSYSMPFQTTYQKDFSSHSSQVSKSSQRINSVSKVSNQNIGSEIGRTAGKLQNTKMSHINHEVVSSSINSLSTATCSGTISASDLDALLNRVTINNTDCSTNLLSHFTTNKPVSCALHHTQRKVKVSERTVELQEAVDILGVPPDLVKVLRSYHRYLEESHLKKTPIEMSKSLLAEKKFIEQLKHSNHSRWNNASCEPLVNLYSDYLSMFVETFNIEEGIGNHIFDGRELAKVQERFECLESNFLRLSNLDESVNSESVFSKEMPEARFRTPESNTVKKNSRTLAGFWNEGSEDLFKGMTQVQCIHYSNAEQWSAFQENLHKIQHLQLQIRVLEILCYEIVPKLWNLDMNDPILPSLFKTCSALCNIAALVTPVLIKS